jgi:hypothetical protein
MRKTICVLAGLILFIAVQGQRTSNGISVIKGERFNVIQSLKDLKPDPLLNPRVTRDLNGSLIKKTWKDTITDYGTKASGDPVVQKAPFLPKNESPEPLEGGPMAGSKIIKNFDGITFTSVSPADPCMTQGPGHIIQMINGSQGAYLQIWNKAGNTVVPQTYMYQLIATPGYSGNGDPIALYDPFSDRYIITEFGTSGGVTTYINTLIFAVSITNDPTGGWYLYKFVDNTAFVDYPHYAVWPNAIFGTSNDFNTAGSTYLGSSVMAFDKTKLLSGDTTVTMIRTIPSFFGTGVNPATKPRTMAPIGISGNTAPANQNMGMFMYYHDDNLTSTSLDVDSIGIITMTPDFANPANTVIRISDRMVAAPFKSNVCASRACIPGGAGYDAISDRFMHRISYRNFGNYEAIVASHTVDANFPALPAKAGVRWYELRRTTGNWSIFQQGTYAPDADSRWMGSININSKGQIGLAYNHSGVNKFASIYFTGRNVNDPTGLMTYDESVIQQGTAYGTFSNRWGDYNDLTTDVSNDSIFWFTAMYGAQNWRTRIASFKLEPPLNLDARLSAVLNPVNGYAQCGNSLTPQITIRNSGATTLNNIRIFTQLNNDPVSPPLNWSGTLRIGESTNVTLSSISAKLGTNLFSVFIDQPNGSVDENKLNDTLRSNFIILSPNTDPIEEGMESANFPPPTGWRVINPNAGSMTWARTINAKNSGIASAFMDFYNYSSNLHEDLLLSPILDVTQSDSVIFQFERAYKPYNTNANYADGLAIVISTDCGATFTEVWRKEGADLASVTGTQTAAFVPKSNEWATTRIDLKPFIGTNPNISVGLKSINRFGNNLYIDDIKLFKVRLPLNDASIRTVINPSSRLCTRSTIPKIVLQNNGRDTLRSVKIFYGIGQNVTDSIEWSGKLSRTATQVIDFAAYNKSIAFSSAGNFAFTVFTKDPNGIKDENSVNDTARSSFTLIEPQAPPIREGFEKAGFPPANWAISTSGESYSWERTSLASSESAASAWIRNFRFNSNGKYDELYSPLISIGQPDSIYLSFDVAHATYKFPGITDSPLDTLEVLLTTDCGNTFRSVYKKWGEDLTTLDKNFPPVYPSIDTVGFYPAGPGQWRKEKIDITRFVSLNSQFQFVFRNIANKGNNTFIDKIDLSTITLPARLKQMGYMIAPNPFSDQLTVRHLQPPVNLKAIKILNTLGQSVYSRQFNGNAPGTVTIDLSSMSDGVYQVLLLYDNKMVTERIVKRK